MKLHFKPYRDFTNIVSKLFRQQKDRISQSIPNAEIQHIGSTAIPGAVTKGDLDIQVRVLKDDFPKAKENLKKLYRINQLKNWSETFASFKDDDSFEIPVGIQLTVIDSEEDNLFRQQQMLLVNNPDLLKQYNQMKLKFEGKGLRAYRAERAKFFDKIKKSLE